MDQYIVFLTLCKIVYNIGWIYKKMCWRRKYIYVWDLFVCYWRFLFFKWVQFQRKNLMHLFRTPWSFLGQSFIWHLWLRKLSWKAWEMQTLQQFCLAPQLSCFESAHVYCVLCNTWFKLAHHYAFEVWWGNMLTQTRIAKLPYVAKKSFIKELEV